MAGPMGHAVSRMRVQMDRLFLTDTVDVERRTPTGSWVVLGSFAACVQYQNGVARSSNDPDEARTTERRSLVVYLPAAAGVDVGMRLLWSGAWWHVGTASPPRGEELYLRLVVEREQLGTAPELVAFRRRVAGAWVDLGTFAVQRTVDQRDGAATGVRSASDAATAFGQIVTGQIVCPAEATGVLAVGDWFTIEGLPGRVTHIDDTDPARLELSYRLEQRGGA